MVTQTRHLGPICNATAPSTLAVPNLHRTSCALPGTHSRKKKKNKNWGCFLSPHPLKSPHDDGPGINRVENADGGERKWRREKPEPDPQNSGLHARSIFTPEPTTEQDPRILSLSSLTCGTNSPTLPTPGHYPISQTRGSNPVPVTSCVALVMSLEPSELGSVVGSLVSVSLCFFLGCLYR